MLRIVLIPQTRPIGMARIARIRLITMMTIPIVRIPIVRIPIAMMIRIIGIMIQAITSEFFFRPSVLLQAGFFMPFF